MQISIDIVGDAAAVFSAYADSMKDKIEAAVAKAGKIVEGDAKAACPVDTGRLRQSITSEAAGMSANIGANTEYAGYVEFGTYKMKAQPYLIPALLNNADTIAGMIKAAL